MGFCNAPFIIMILCVLQLYVNHRRAMIYHGREAGSAEQTAEEEYDILNSGFRLLLSAGGHD